VVPVQRGLLVFVGPFNRCVLNATGRATWSVALRSFEGGGADEVGNALEAHPVRGGFEGELFLRGESQVDLHASRCATRWRTPPHFEHRRHRDRQRFARGLHALVGRPSVGHDRRHLDGRADVSKLGAVFQNNPILSYNRLRAPEQPGIERHVSFVAFPSGIFSRGLFRFS